MPGQPLPKKHIPQRTCIACRQVQGKRSLIRLVRSDEEGIVSVLIDATGKRGGRGCYLHPNQQCWQIGLKGGKIEQALRTKLSARNRAELSAFAETLPATAELSEVESGPEKV